MMRLFLALALMLTSSVTYAGDIVAVETAFTVSPAFKKNDDARLALSGAACVSGTSHCLVANDEKKYAEFFEVGPGDILHPGRVIKLLADSVGGVEMKEIDAEAVTYTNGYYFVTGSHGLSRKKAELRLSMFNVFRFPVDPVSGTPTFAFNEDTPVVQIEASTKLREIIAAQAELKLFAEQPLNHNGASIEGMVADGADLLFGFRAPVLGEQKNQAVILRVNQDALFGSAEATGDVVLVSLEPSLGIRDMAHSTDGVLLLAGSSADTSGPASLWLWDGVATKAMKLGDLPVVDASKKAETLLVLSEDASAINILLMFDGQMDGGPQRFIVHK